MFRDLLIKYKAWRRSKKRDCPKCNDGKLYITDKGNDYCELSGIETINSECDKCGHLDRYRLFLIGRRRN